MSFYNLFILSCFKQNYEMKTTTLYHLLKGKRTSSILSYGYFYEVLPFFGLFPKLDEKKYKMTIDDLKNKQLIVEIDGYAKQTVSGLELLSQVQMPQTSALNQLRFYRWDVPYFERLLFASQVISEKAYESVDYLPLETNFYKQLQLKAWLKKQEKDLASHFYLEWRQLITYLTHYEQELILSQLVGHDIWGLTLNQIADKQNKEPFFIFLSFKNAWHKLLQAIIEEKEAFPLLSELLQLELSVYQNDTRKATLHLFKKGHCIEEIAQIRKLKVGTITDHIIDEFLVTRNNCYLPTFSEEIQLGLEELLKNKPLFFQWTYQEALLICPNISFYEFRFFQFHLKEKELKNG